MKESGCGHTFTGFIRGHVAPLPGVAQETVSPLGGWGRTRVPVGPSGAHCEHPGLLPLAPTSRRRPHLLLVPQAVSKLLTHWSVGDTSDRSRFMMD